MGHHIATSGYGFQYTQMVETRLRFVKKRKIKVTMVNGWSSGLTQLYIPKIAQGSCLLTGGEPGSLKHMAFRCQNWPWTAWLVKSLFVLCDMWKNIPWYTWSWLDTSSISFTLVIKHGNGRSPTTAGFNGKITHTWGTLHCHVWLPAGILIDVFGSWISLLFTALQYAFSCRPSDFCQAAIISDFFLGCCGAWSHKLNISRFQRDSSRRKIIPDESRTPVYHKQIAKAATTHTGQNSAHPNIVNMTRHQAVILDYWNTEHSSWTIVGSKAKQAFSSSLCIFLPVDFFFFSFFFVFTCQWL